MRKRLVLVDERGGPSPLNRLIYGRIYGRIIGKEGHPPGAEAETIHRVLLPVARFRPSRQSPSLPSLQ
jgi:hypothetical protein